MLALNYPDHYSLIKRRVPVHTLDGLQRSWINKLEFGLFDPPEAPQFDNRPDVQANRGIAAAGAPRSSGHLRYFRGDACYTSVPSHHFLVQDRHFAIVNRPAILTLTTAACPASKNIALFRIYVAYRSLLSVVLLIMLVAPRQLVGALIPPCTSGWHWPTSLPAPCLARFSRLHRKPEEDVVRGISGGYCRYYAAGRCQWRHGQRLCPFY